VTIIEPMRGKHRSRQAEHPEDEQGPTALTTRWRDVISV
jgi:hypothetical protein